MSAEAEVLSAPLTLPNGVTIQNRLGKAAMSECLGDANCAPTPRLIRLYERWSRSGAGLLVTGNVMIDRTAIGEAGNVAVDDDRDHAVLSAWAQAARADGAHVLAQINHPGRQVLWGVSNRPVAPSAVRVKKAAGVFSTPRELSAREIDDLVIRFARSAGILVRAGFSGVEIHAAHGYLIGQFLSPSTNLRNDAWGGDPERRRRFLLEVVRAVRAEIGGHAILAVKLNSADFQRGGFTEDESADVVRALGDEAVDIIEISGGTYETTAFMGVGTSTKASTLAREAYFLQFAERVRGELKTPLMLTGGFRTAAGMAYAIESGAIDLVGLARPLALEPDLPARLLAGSAQSSSVKHRRLGIERFDGMTDLMWHNAQLQRMARGADPAPHRHPIATLAEYSCHLAPYAARRALRTLR